MELLLAAGAPWPGAVAVSGGGDSIALMHLLARWAKQTRRAPPLVVTVDHGLHPDARRDAARVMRWAKAAKLLAHTLRWTGPHPKSDIEAAAREARYRLIGNWAGKHGIAALYVGHTRDDQAETFLLRLARGSGLDGLAAMRAHAPYPLPGFASLPVIRPLLAFDRDALRAHLTEHGHAWLEDPMNGEDRFARVRLRKLIPALEAAGVSRARIAGAAAHLARAREALDVVTDAVLARAARVHDGAIHIDPRALAAAPREIGLRALAQLLMRVSGQAYRPRFERLERLYDRLAAGTLGGGVTLHGCKIALAPAKKGAFGPGTLTVTAETARARGKRTNHSVLS
ncbi:MAG TPA: tRNA lysidine(34) synthetase TilS [Rhizomicrobium sp.]|nr:tRNA lysidine(34) synthetase TilS [Rhizomicrobium sp.]